MRKTLVVALLVAAWAVTLALRPGAQRPAPAADGTPAEQALRAARAAGQPVVLSFRSASCIPCQAMVDVAAELRQRYIGRAAIIDVSLDPDTPDAALVAQWGIHAKPTTVVLGPDGKLSQARIGVWPTAELVARLDAMLRR
ncbi:MAG: thioredoxin family protein [Fimbriimonadaceae bacterium]|nr:thioredoxin family protein [Fimbriimonadaceae bacterium]